MITPAIRRLAQMPYDKLRRLDPRELNVAEAIARAAILAALDVANGTKDRADVTDRLDGALARPDINVNQRSIVLIREIIGADPELLA